MLKQQRRPVFIAQRNDALPGPVRVSPPRRAVEEYKTALKYDPLHADTMCNLGSALQDLGDYPLSRCASSGVQREALRSFVDRQREGSCYWLIGGETLFACLERQRTMFFAPVVVLSLARTRACSDHNISNRRLTRTASPV